MLPVARLIASRYIDRIGNIHSRGTLRCSRMLGSHCEAVSSSSGRSLAPEPLAAVQVPEVRERALEVPDTRRR